MDPESKDKRAQLAPARGWKPSPTPSPGLAPTARRPQAAIAALPAWPRGTALCPRPHVNTSPCEQALGTALSSGNTCTFRSPRGREADTRARPLPHLWTGDGRPVKPGDAASHLRADHAWGAWGAGLALETLGGESRHTEMAEVARAAPSAPAPARRTPRTSLGGARPSRPLLLSFKGTQQARRCHEVLCAAFVLRNTF